MKPSFQKGASTVADEDEEEEEDIEFDEDFEGKTSGKLFVYDIRCTLPVQPILQYMLP
jgi:hypothetical protein